MASLPPRLASALLIPPRSSPSLRQYGVDTAHTRAHRASYLPRQQLEAETSKEADQWHTKGKGWQLELVDKGLKKD